MYLILDTFFVQNFSIVFDLFIDFTVWNYFIVLQILIKFRTNKKNIHTVYFRELYYIFLLNCTAFTHLHVKKLNKNC